MDLHLIWFVIMGALLAGYAILDGFDLGVGMLHPLAQNDRERRLFMGAIGPIWDGNEVWLVTFGGALFAMFPEAYATIFSGFYLAFMLLLFALIARAVSIEFRSKVHAEGWRRFWDGSFFASSFVATLVFGIGVGNAIGGLPLDERGAYVGGLFDLLRPYPVLIGFLAVALFAMHGAIYLFLKTSGGVQERLGRWMWHTWGLFLFVYLLATILTLLRYPHAAANFGRHPWAVAGVVLNILAITNIPRAFFRGKYGEAFVSSSVTIACMVFLFAMALYPNVLVASNDPARSWTIVNAASSEKTLRIGLLIAGIGMPFVLAYTGIVYWAFRGKVKAEESIY
ncbi:MAG TPA: cytochrome d ubiquinol oxidase subunit II [Candidatus Eisenbacteria bacterium]|nr:cytochrome d ubiquinol oxidase subunit II [Candidatus Eisenbacteria bacterium]